MPKISRLWSDPRVKPPFGVAEIDWGHLLIANLLAAFFLTEGGGISLRDERSGRNALGTGSESWGAGSMGQGLESPTNQLSLLSVSQIPTDYPFWLHALTAASPGNNGTQRSAASFIRSNSVGAYSVGWQGSGGLTASEAGTITGSTLGLGVPVHLTGSYESSTSRKLYENGVQVGSYTVSTAFLSLDGVSVGPSGDTSLKGQVALALFYAGLMGLNTLAWLVAEPYAMLRPIVRRRYFVPTGVVPPLMIDEGGLLVQRVSTRRLLI